MVDHKRARETANCWKGGARIHPGDVGPDATRNLAAAYLEDHAEVERLRGEVEKLTEQRDVAAAERDVRDGTWCAQAEGRGPCGTCRGCALAEVERLREALGRAGAARLAGDMVVKGAPTLTEVRADELVDRANALTLRHMDAVLAKLTEAEAERDAAHAEVERLREALGQPVVDTLRAGKRWRDERDVAIQRAEAAERALAVEKAMVRHEFGRELSEWVQRVAVRSTDPRRLTFSYEVVEALIDSLLTKGENDDAE